MTKTQKREFNKLSGAIKQTMIDITYSNYYRQLDNREETIDNDIDVAFFAIGNCFPEFNSIGDTVTRRCAKTEIYTLLDSLKNVDVKDRSDYINNNITAESVLDDIMEMNSD